MSLRSTRTLTASLMLAMSLAAVAAQPPSGRYRCYQPPGYHVTAWFDLYEDGRYRFQGGDPAHYDFDGASDRVTWIDGELADDHLGGRYFPPSEQAPTGRRHAIVLERREPGTPGSECFLTTH